MKDSTKNIRSALADSARAIRNDICDSVQQCLPPINDAALTINVNGETVNFSANASVPQTVDITVPTAVAQLTDKDDYLKKEELCATIESQCTKVPLKNADNTFTGHNDFTDSITVPSKFDIHNIPTECTRDAVNICDLLAVFDSLNRRRKLDSLKPALTLTASIDTVIVCEGSTKAVNYTATFHNCSSSDYKIAWKVNGTDSSNVTTPTFTFNAPDIEGDYEVVCVATRSGNVTVTDTVTTTVKVSAIPSFDTTVSKLTVNLKNITNTVAIQWDMDSLFVPFSGGTTISHTYSVADTVTITAMNADSCTFSKKVVLHSVAPEVTTDSVPASTLAATTAIAYGTVTFDGGIPETKRGILYSTSDQNLEYGANGVDSVVNGTGKGNYACTLERLVPCTQYYVRAFAYNEVDTVYGAILNFTTPSFTCGSTLYDIDGNDYATLQLGSQCWMKQNLRVTHYANGDTILLSTSTVGTTSPYRYEPDSNLTTYGYLYNWYAAARSTSSATNPSNVQGVCPDGWHLPSDAEWTQLTDFVASNSANVCGNDPISIGKSMVSKEGWPASSSQGCRIGSNTDANNSTGFSIPSSGTWDCGGGVGTNGEGYTNNGHAIFVSATENDNPTYTVYCREFYYNDSIAERTAPHKTFGRSVRCVRDCATGHTYLPTVSAVKITNTDGTIRLAAYVDSDGGATVSERGVCWSGSQHPTTSSDHATSGSGIGEFSVPSTLTPGIAYYVRAYAKNSEGWAYGAEVKLVVPNPPTVTTASVTEIATFTATTGGEVTYDGGATETVRGVCWSKSENPTIGAEGCDTTLNGTGMGSFTSNITGLTANTTYYVRAYASNKGGTVYGDQESFTTFDTLPEVTTSAVSNIAVTTGATPVITVTCGGNVTDTGAYAVTARGVCWSTSQNPTISGSHTTNGSGSGSFTSNIEGLTDSTTYYVRAYATNSVGTAYGNQVTLTIPVIDTNSCPNAPTVIDHEGNVYATVKITGKDRYGNNHLQCWMRENMRATTSPKTGTYLVNTEGLPGGDFPKPSQYLGSKVAHWFNHDSATYAPKGYGLLYNWCAAMDTANPTNYVEVPTTSINGNNSSITFNLPDPHRGICPVGWHVPTYNDWDYLLRAVGSNAVILADGNDWRDCEGSSSGNTPCNKNHADRNASGFTALPAGMFGYGYRFGEPTGSFQDNERYAYFWCSMQMGDEPKVKARSEYLCYSYETLTHSTSDEKGKGFSVRCIRNEGHAAQVFVTTGAASNIAQTSATLNGSISNASNITITNRGFELKETVGGSYTPVTPDVDDPLSCNLTGLTPNTAYTFRAFATTSEGTMYGYERSFTTLPPPLSLTASSDDDPLIVWTGSETSITYTATFFDVSSSDYTISWKVNGTDSTENGQQLTVNVGDAGSYKVVCIATHVDDPNLKLKDSITTNAIVVGNIVDLSTLTSNYQAQNYDILTDTLIGNYQISIADGATVTLRGATIDFGADGGYEWAGITCLGDATIRLQDINVVKVANGKPGIHIPKGYTLTIQGPDSLYVGSNGNGAGIGGGKGISCGNIVIEGGKIEAKGGQYAAGIGSGYAYIDFDDWSGYQSSCGNIDINDGSVTAIGGQYAAGIGSGLAQYVSNSCGKITISGGKVTARGGIFSAGIGTGYAFAWDVTCSCGNIDISGTTTNVTAYGGELGPGIGAGNATSAMSECKQITISGGTVRAKGAANGNGSGAGIGTSGNNSSGYSKCGDIEITDNVISVHAEKGGTNGFKSIGRGKDHGYNTCGTVRIGDETHADGIPDYSFTYEP